MSSHGRKKNTSAVSFRLIQYVLVGGVVVAILLAFGLQMFIMSRHHQLHFEKMKEYDGDNNDVDEKTRRIRRKPVHYVGEEDTEVEQEIMEQHDSGHADDHEHADEDPHMHVGDTGDMVLDYQLPEGFQHVLTRAKHMQQHCHDLDLPEADQMAILNKANVTADLPAFGIIHALESYRPKTADEANMWKCELPPETECEETQMTVVFLGYRPDRLAAFKMQVHRMTFENEASWNGIVKEVILVWNGDRELTETKAGRVILKWAANPEVNFRIFYPLKEGFPNDLMNRYHPRFNIQTKAVLFYDDDGPFYRVEAVTSGFELWKRNSKAQIGAMARRLDVAERAKLEKEGLPQGEHEWVSNCRAGGDTVRYNFQYFAQTGANMALPSGSFLHRNYMCFLWHPVLEEIREFVRAHPVHPDDVTVSTIVSHVSGHAPKVYSRRVNKPDTPPGSIVEATDAKEGVAKLDTVDPPGEAGAEEAAIVAAEERRLFQVDDEIEVGDPSRRRLLWDDGNHGVWARKRESSVNSLLGYFGSINSGSDGWCFDTPYHNTEKNVCVPDQAREGMLNWMTADMKPLQCPEYRKITEKQYMATK